MTGIYSIKNNVNNKRYIGKAELDCRRRISQHKWNLRKGKHINRHLQSAWDTYGEENFTFEILEECTLDTINSKEIYWIEKYKTLNRKYGYNKTAGGTGGDTTAGKTSIELLAYKEKLRASSIGKNNILTEKQVVSIKRDMLEGKTDKELSVEYKVTLSTINKIRMGINWSWVLEEINEYIKNYKKNKKEEAYNEITLVYIQTGSYDNTCEILNSKYGKYKILKVIGEYNKKVQEFNKSKAIELYKQGMFKQDIAKTLNINRNTVARYLKSYANTEIT